MIKPWFLRWTRGYIVRDLSRLLCLVGNDDGWPAKFRWVFNFPWPLIDRYWSLKSHYESVLSGCISLWCNDFIDWKWRQALIHQFQFRKLGKQPYFSFPRFGKIRQHHQSWKIIMNNLVICLLPNQARVTRRKTRIF